LHFRICSNFIPIIPVGDRGNGSLGGEVLKSDVYLVLQIIGGSAHLVYGKNGERAIRPLDFNLSGIDIHIMAFVIFPKGLLIQRVGGKE